MHLLAATTGATGGDPHAWLTYLEGILICVATGSGLIAGWWRFGSKLGRERAERRHQQRNAPIVTEMASLRSELTGPEGKLTAMQDAVANLGTAVAGLRSDVTDVKDAGADQGRRITNVEGRLTSVEQQTLRAEQAAAAARTAGEARRRAEQAWLATAEGNAATGTGIRHLHEDHDSLADQIAERVLQALRPDSDSDA